MNWPEGFDELVLRFVSRWPRSAVDISEVRIKKPSEESGGVLRGDGIGHMALHSASADPLKPVKFVVEGQFLLDRGSGVAAQIVGETEFAVRTFDPKKDVITGAPVLDER
ncbi:MAG: hypothetical protein ACRDKE_12800, partial [Solirubrobacterales bacterium]